MSTCRARKTFGEVQVMCIREEAHDGVHLGRVPQEDGTVELEQWTGTEPEQGMSEEPLWYRVLPLGAQVWVDREGDAAQVSGELIGAVMDDHEQPAGIIVREELDPSVELEDRTVTHQRVLIPWGRVQALSWEDSAVEA